MSEKKPQISINAHRPINELWEAYREDQLRSKLFNDETLREIRKAFFTGVWAQLTFTKKILQMPEVRALDLMSKIEREASFEVGLFRERVAKRILTN